jgi:hypothetical protein
MRSRIRPRRFGAVADCQEALANRRIAGSVPVVVPSAHNAAVTHPITRRFRSIPRWPTPLTVMVSTWAGDGTDRSPGTMMSSAAVTDSHRTPSGNGVEASRRNSGDPGRSARTISTTGSTPAQGDPPNGEPSVITVSTRPISRGFEIASAIMTPPRLCQTRCTLSARCRANASSTSAPADQRAAPRISDRRIGHRVDTSAPRTQGLRNQGPARLDAVCSASRVW